MLTAHWPKELSPIEPSHTPPASLADCSHMEVLDLKGNSLSSLPTGLGKLSASSAELARNRPIPRPNERLWTIQIDLAGNNGCNRHLLRSPSRV